ncbi:hypothetical protein ACFH04_07455 [Streptomyces noboritoensis]|uniref:Uncharacterized protein n=1 Tax=Streptomyces noboritoensis TaxID=67337 RepID=A0ABV6TCQ1_9ACTN
MTCIDDILSRALLARDRHVPRDVVPPTATPHPTTSHLIPGDVDPGTAGEDLRALCETLVTHTPAADIATFVTDQVPEPRSALVLACVLQLTDTSDGARFWWEYAAGAGQSAAAYCLYLHHLALGECETADWWHHQADTVSLPPGAPAPEPEADVCASGDWHAGNHRLTHTSTTTILRVLRHLAKYTARPRPAVVTELMAYVPTAVAVGYLRQPDMDLPMPGPGFAHQIRTLLDAAAHRPPVPGCLPARPTPESRATRRKDPAPRPPSTSTETACPQIGEAAAR